MEKFFVVLSLVLLSACSSDHTPGEDRTKLDGSDAADGGSSGSDRDGSGNLLPFGSDGAVEADAMVDGGMPSSDAGSDADVGSDAAMGSDAMVDVDATIPDPECESPSTKCEGLKRFSCVSGSWEEKETCGHVCQDGVCSGVCDPGDQDCSGLTPRTCNSNGQWVNAQACSFVCSAGECSGSCVPGDRDCSGKTPRSCNSAGAWVNETTCSLYCGGEGVCSGVCVPGDRDCSGKTPRSCSATAQWVNETACPFVCGGKGVCSGSCTPDAHDCSGDVPRTCNSAGSWTNGLACPFVCSAGSCAGVCEPGDRDCSGKTPRSCNSAGQWVTETACSFICGGEGVCSGSCSPGTTDCSGTTPRSCNSSGQWISGSACQFACSAGACSGVCTPGATQCSGQQIQTCGSNGQWQTAANCGAVAGADSFCSAGACTFNCKLDYDDCDNNAANGCEVDLNSNADNCGQCGHSCCGGACGAGTCGLNTTGIPSSVGKYAVDAKNIYWTTASEVNQRPISGGATITLASNQPNAQGLTVYGSEVIWSTSGDTQTFGGMFSKPIGGGTLKTYASNSGAAAQLIATADDIFYVAATSQNAVSYIRKSDNLTDILLGGAATYSTPIVTDGTYIYATYVSTGTASNQKVITRVPLHGGTATTFATFSPLNPTSAFTHAGLSIDSTNVYYMMFVGAEPTKSGLWKKPISGGAATQLASGTGLASTTASDGTYVYYADANARQVRKVSVNGGTSTSVTTLPGSGSYSFLNMQVVNSCLYWTGSSGIQAMAVNP